MSVLDLLFDQQSIGLPGHGIGTPPPGFTPFVSGSQSIDLGDGFHMHVTYHANTSYAPDPPPEGLSFRVTDAEGAPYTQEIYVSFDARVYFSHAAGDVILNGPLLAEFSPRSETFNTTPRKVQLTFWPPEELTPFDDQTILTAPGAVSGGAGNDQLIGSERDDLLSAGTGDDTLLGGAGDDWLVAKAGSNVIDGGDGEDWLVLDFDRDAIQETYGVDHWLDALRVGDTVEVAPDGAISIHINGTTQHIRNVEFLWVGERAAFTYLEHELWQFFPGGDEGQYLDAFRYERGGAGGDLIDGAYSYDTLFGGGGNDTIWGRDGLDELHGEDGDDYLHGSHPVDDLTTDRADVIYAGDGNDTAFGGYGNDHLFGMDGDDVLSGGFGADSVIGQNGNDVVSGGAFSDVLFGNAGEDFLNGGFGHDRINGGAGADKFFHVGAEGHGSDWVQDYDAAEGDVLLFGGADATAEDFQVNFTHTASRDGERAGADAVQEAFVIYKPTGQILWALVDGGGQDQINLQIGGEVFDLLG